MDAEINSTIESGIKNKSRLSFIWLIFGKKNARLIEIHNH